MQNEPSKGYGVEETAHPTALELETMNHVYVPYTMIKRYQHRSEWIQHPDVPHLQGFAPGYYVLFYKRES